MSKVFISYRRADSLTITGRIHDRLVAAFGEKNIFKDVDDIEPGVDFRQVILDAIDESDVELVIIGKRWLDLRNAQGKRRIDEANDFVRMEVQTGLEKAGLRVIPVLVGGAAMPDAQDLPDVIKELAFKNAMVVREDPDFNDDTATLINAIERIVGTDKKGIGLPTIIGMIIALLLMVGIAGFVLSQGGLGEVLDPTGTTLIASADDATDDSTSTPDPTATPEADTPTATEAEASPTAIVTESDTAMPPTEVVEVTDALDSDLTIENGAVQACEIVLRPGFAAVNARSGPSTDFRVVRRIVSDERVEVVGRQRADGAGFFWWLTIEETWVSNANVRAEGDCDNIEIVR